MIDLSKTLERTKSLVIEVGDFIRKESDNFTKSDIELKGFNDLVSYVDKEAEKQLVAGCSEILPEAGFIAEEGTSDKTGDTYNWIIDPLDGTTNFTHGLPIYAISLALMAEDKIVLGIVYEINKDECFYAIEGENAYLNDQVISVSKVPKLSGSLLATGFPYYDFEQMSKYLSILNDFMQQTHGLRRMGSAAVDLAYVACGRFEGFFEYNLNAWDVAAGAFIVERAGGNVTDFKCGPDYIFGREILAAGPVHTEMLEVIQKHWLA
ncbi:inositol monophosphatase [Fulvivirga sp. RKSG066]|uniref:inositol monophosphatase family protein n=1 Tax=Fulvivirga aurantia TaxID=2529383 RepID=UPI0012BBE06B|nr:inositol monophosphatase family protein [Fulvivirga aurantia]MTI19904.1 inositol monophosphatase [Fulvivirga aurantia]